MFIAWASFCNDNHLPAMMAVTEKPHHSGVYCNKFVRCIKSHLGISHEHVFSGNSIIIKHQVTIVHTSIGQLVSYISNFDSYNTKLNKTIFFADINYLSVCFNNKATCFPWCFPKQVDTRTNRQTHPQTDRKKYYTWHRFMVIHASNLYNKAVYSMAFPLTVQLGHQDHMVTGFTH